MAAADSDQYSIFGDALPFIQQTSLCVRHSARQGEAQNGSVEVRKHMGLRERLHTARDTWGAEGTGNRTRWLKGCVGWGSSAPSEASPVPLELLGASCEMPPHPHDISGTRHRLSTCQPSSSTRLCTISLPFQLGARTHRGHVSRD